MVKHVSVQLSVSALFQRVSDRVEQAIAKARSSTKYQDLFASFRGVAFFATPHRGGYGATVGAATAGGVRRFTGNPRSSIMEALRADSLISADIHQYFLNSLDKIRICTFYELKPMPGLRHLVSKISKTVASLSTGK